MRWRGTRPRETHMTYHRRRRRVSRSFATKISLRDNNYVSGYNVDDDVKGDGGGERPGVNFSVTLELLALRSFVVSFIVRALRDNLHSQRGY